MSLPKHLLQLHETHQRHTNQHRVGNKGLQQGRPQLCLQKSYQFQVPKTNPKLAPIYLLVLIIQFSFSVMLMKEIPYFHSLQSRRFEARRGLAEATPRTQNVLAQGQSEAHGDLKLYNKIVEVPARLNLK